MKRFSKIGMRLLVLTLSVMMTASGCTLNVNLGSPTGQGSGTTASAGQTTRQGADKTTAGQATTAAGTTAAQKTEAATKAATEAPTQAATEAPTQAPTEAPTQAPTEAPTQAPTEAPTQAPTEAPTQAPTEAPTQAATEAPTQAATEAPTQAADEEHPPENSEGTPAAPADGAPQAEGVTGDLKLPAAIDQMRSVLAGNQNVSTTDNALKELRKKFDSLRDLGVDAGRLSDVIGKQSGQDKPGNSSGSSAGSILKDLTGLKNLGGLNIQSEIGSAMKDLTVSATQPLFQGNPDAEQRYSKKDTVTKPTPEDLDMPLVSRLGRGYDAFGEYADETSVRDNVLDLSKLIQTNDVEVKVLDTYMGTENIAESLQKYVKQRSLGLSTSGGYLCFKGSIDTSFNKEQTTEASNYFASLEQILLHYNPCIKYRSDFINFLTPRCREDLAKESPETIFKRYGQFVLLNYLVGGKICYDVTNSSKDSKTVEDFSLNVKAEFNAIIASAGGTTQYARSNTFDDYTRTATRRWYYKGGLEAIPTAEQFATDKEAVSRWNEALKTHGAMVGFNKSMTPLLPIWELIEDQHKREEVHQYYNKMVDSFKQNLPPEINYGKRYLKEIYLGTSKDEQRAREEATFYGGICLEPEVNYKSGGAYVFLAPKFGDPGDSKNAITDLLVRIGYNKGDANIELNHQGTRNLYSLVWPNDTNIAFDYEMKQWKSDPDKYPKPTAYHFQWGVANLNRDAGGKWIFLYRTREYARHKAPIYDIMMYDGGGGDYWPAYNQMMEFCKDNEWEPVYFAHSSDAANLNHHAGGHHLWLLVKRDYSLLPANLQ